MYKINIFPIVISRQTMHILTLKKLQPAAPQCDMLHCVDFDWFLRQENIYCHDLLCACISLNYSACQRGPFLAGQYISFSVIVSAIATVLVDKIVEGKRCFNLAFNRLILVATIRTTVTEPANSPVLHSSELRTCGVSSPELKSPKGFFFNSSWYSFWQN